MILQLVLLFVIFLIVVFLSNCTRKAWQANEMPQAFTAAIGVSIWLVIMYVHVGNMLG